MNRTIKKLGRVILHSHEGFTLIEMLVVISIIGMIAGLIGPKIFKGLKKAGNETAKAQIKQLEAALGTFRLDIGRFPTSEEGLDALLTQPSGLDKWDGSYFQKETIPLDPWGNDYEYIYPGEHGEFDITSKGPDGQGGSEDDIMSWK
ncbi:MAG: type II secretion system major pseudopilin GspG [bacterium]